MSMKPLRVMPIVCFGLALLALPVSVTLADNAPMYETPFGLEPGVKDTTVRMASEQVDVQVIERGDAAVAVVNATFNMSNSGPAVQVLTGFPNEIYDPSPGSDLAQGIYD